MFPGMFLKCGTWYCTTEVLECCLAEFWPVQAGICFNCSQVGFEVGDHSQEVVFMQSPGFRELRGLQSRRELFCVSCPQCLGTLLCTLTVLVNVPLSLTQSENLPKPLPPFAFHVTFASQRTWTHLRSLFTWCLFKLCFSKCHCSWLCVSDFLSSVTSTDLKWGSRAWTLCRSTFWICKTLVNNINCFVMCWLKVKIKDLLL